MKNKNTKFTVGYRDADNYQASNFVILAGVITEQQIEQLNEALSVESQFVAHEIGLPNPALKFIGYDGFPNPQLDHGYNYIVECHDENYEGILTDEEPNTDMSIDDFIKAINEAPCCAASEYERFFNLKGLEVA